jgi:hypothetical protein
MLTLKMRWGRAVTFIGAYAVVLFSIFGLLLLPDQNIAAKQPVSKKERIPGLNRGVGLSILERLAEQYRGTFTYGLKNSRFCAVLTMQTSEVR